MNKTGTAKYLCQKKKFFYEQLKQAEPQAKLLY
jgi:hypothetical protein